MAPRVFTHEGSAGRPLLGRREAAARGGRRGPARRHPRSRPADAAGGLRPPRRGSHGPAPGGLRLGAGGADASPTASRSGRGPTRCAVRSATPSSATCGRCGPGPIGGRCSSPCWHRSGPWTPTAWRRSVSRRLHALGLTLPHYGPHVLRHACATHLLAQGLSLKEIGDHLGHQSPETTRIYAKVDLAALAGRRGLRSGGPAMNINDLVTHYVAFRRTLGERCKTNEKHPSILLPRRRAADAGQPDSGRSRGRVPGRHRADHQAWHIKYYALKGFFRFAVSRGHLDKAPLPTELPKRPPTFVPYIYSREELRRLLDAIPSYRRLPQPDRTAHPAGDPAAAVRGRVAARRSAEPVGRGRGLAERPAHHPRHQVLQVPAGSHRPDLTKVLSEYARWRAATHPSAGADSRFFLDRDGNAVHLVHVGRRVPAAAGTRRRAALRRRLATSLGCTTCGTPSRSTA